MSERVSTVFGKYIQYTRYIGPYWGLEKREEKLRAIWFGWYLWIEDEDLGDDHEECRNAQSAVEMLE